MTDFLQVSDQGQHRKHGFDQHPVVPGAARAEFQVGWIAFAGVKAGIRQDDHAVVEPLNQWISVMRVGRRHQPTDDLPL